EADKLWTSDVDERLLRGIDGSKKESLPVVGLYETAERLIKGNLGEKFAAESLSTLGHEILYYKPDIRGTNQGGIDMVTLADGPTGPLVSFVDNKALSRGGNINSVSALTTNFEKNKDAVLKDLKEALGKASPGKQYNVLQSAIHAIEQGQ